MTTETLESLSLPKKQMEVISEHQSCGWVFKRMDGVTAVMVHPNLDITHAVWIQPTGDYWT